MRKFLFLLLSFCVGQALSQDFPLLKISNQNKSVYLIGSFHVGNTPITDVPELNSIIKKSGVMCMETDPSDTENIKKSKDAILLNPVGISLKDRIGPALYAQIRERLSANPQFLKNIDFFSPFFISTTLINSLPAIQEANLSFRPAYSLDNYIKDKAGSLNIPIKAIEDKDAVIKAFSRISDDEWKQYISGTIKIVDCQKCSANYVADMKASYIPSKDFNYTYDRGKAAISSEIELVSIFEKLFYGKRNLDIAANIETQALEKNKCGVIVVGAGHLGGNNGLVNILRNRGLKVEPQILK